MKYSEYFIPTQKDTPSEAEIISHKLMLRAGMIKQSSAGIYSWLPLGLRVLKKIENICYKLFISWPIKHFSSTSIFNT